jgi:hypothetical protein
MDRACSKRGGDAEFIKDFGGKDRSKVPTRKI